MLCYKCWVNGLAELLEVMLKVQVLYFPRVNGLLLNMNAATNVNECAQECHALDACNWFTYDSEGPACVLTEDRDSTFTCTTCTYGHKGCAQRGTAGMITIHSHCREMPFSCCPCLLSVCLQGGSVSSFSSFLASQKLLKASWPWIPNLVNPL